MIIQRMSDGSLRVKPIEDAAPKMKATSGSAEYSVPTKKKIKWDTKNDKMGDFGSLTVYVNGKRIGSTTKDPKTLVRSYIKKTLSGTEVKVTG